MGRGMAGWRYGSGSEARSRRDLRLDLLRGWCVVVMVIDHIGGEGSWLYALTGGNRFFVSAAEGFVLISGIVMGSVYASVIAREGVAGMVARVLRRVRTLYVLTVALTLSFVAVSAALASPWTREAAPGRAGDIALEVVTLHRSYSLADVLLLYTFLVLAAVPILALLARRRTALALAASWTLWGIWQLAPQAAAVPWAIVDEGFPFAAWQAIFMTGIVVGFHRERIERALSAGVRAALVWTATVATAAIVAAYALGLVVPPSLFSEGTLGSLGDLLFNKDDARIGRLVVLALVGIAGYGLLTALWRPVAAVAGRGLIPLGQHALAAYGVHIFVVAASATALAEPLRQAGGNSAVQLAGLALVALATFAIVRLASSRPAPPAAQPTFGRVPWTVVARPAGIALGVILLASACIPIPERAEPSPIATAVETAAPTPSPTPPPTLEELNTPLSESRVVSGRFRSAILDREMPYYVFVPPGYDDDATKRYPVLYMLHGMGGSNIEWLGYGLAKTAERLMRSGEIPPFLIVFPQGDYSYWMDHADGGPRWGTYAARDVVGEVDARYRTLADRRYRGIGGLSMGADGALQLALNFPEVFGVAGGHSPFLRRETEALAYFGRGADYAARDPWTLALARPDVARTISLWIDVGDRDDRLTVITDFHRSLEDAGIPHAWREYIGTHSEEYWGGYSPQYLRYYAAIFCGLGDDPRTRRIDAAAGAACPPYPSARR